MNRILRWGFAAALLPIAACSSNPPPPPVAAAPPPPALNDVDQTFIQQAAVGGMAEVQLGQLAAQKATRPAVKQFGQEMVDQHTPVNQQLMQLAQAKGVTPPSALDPMHQQMFDKLNGAKAGAAWDRDYLRGQIADHRATLALMQREAAEGSDADLKALAAQTAPVVQQHLTEATALVGPAPAATTHRRATRHHTTTHH